jgi:hypothetical protein
MNDKNPNKFLFIHKKRQINFTNRPYFTNDDFLKVKITFFL